MISCGVRLEKFLNYLLIFLIPTQLALHFWPPSAFVFGIRIDYLAPSIYLTDILFLTVFLIWIRNQYKIFFEFVGRNEIFIILFVSLAVFNTAFSTSIFPSIYKWLKLIEFALFSYYVWERREIFNSRILFSTLFYSLVFFSTIGIGQFVFGRTLGGPFYFLGERNFNISTPGIALVSILGKNFIRAYSTFSHPNSFAGFLGLGLITVLFAYSKKEITEKILGMFVICFALILTFSLSAFVGIALCVVLLILIRAKLSNAKYISYIPGALLLISLVFPLVSRALLQNRLSFPQNIRQRIELSSLAGSMISQKFLLGEGLNTFVVNAPRIKFMGSYLWNLQPVHNVFLLIFSETGILGLLFAYLLLVKLSKKALLSDNKMFYLALVFILVTGLVDHYWFTLQQNTLLLATIFGISFREEGKFCDKQSLHLENSM